MNEQQEQQTVERKYILNVVLSSINTGCASLPLIYCNIFNLQKKKKKKKTFLHTIGRQATADLHNPKKKFSFLSANRNTAFQRWLGERGSSQNLADPPLVTPSNTARGAAVKLEAATQANTARGAALRTWSRHLKQTTSKQNRLANSQLNKNKLI